MRGAEAREVHIGKVVRNAVLPELEEHLSATDLASLRKITGEIEERFERFDRR